MIELHPFSSSSNFSSLSANVTGAPLFGRAYNGIQFNLTNPDEFVLERQNATRIQLPAAVFQAAVQSPQGLVGSFDAGKFVDLSSAVYVSFISRNDGYNSHFMVIDDVFNPHCQECVLLTYPRASDNTSEDVPEPRMVEVCKQRL